MSPNHPFNADAPLAARRLTARWAFYLLLLAATMLATASLRHFRLRAHSPRRVARVNLRRICSPRRVDIGSQASGFAQQRSIAWHRAAPLLWLRLPKPNHRIRHWSRPFLFQAAAPAQTPPLLLTHKFGCPHAKVALRCTTDSFPLALSQLVAQALLHRPSPNYRWSGQAGSNVPQSTTVAACRSPTR